MKKIIEKNELIVVEDLFSKEVRDSQTRMEQTDEQYLKRFSSLYRQYKSERVTAYTIRMELMSGDVLSPAEVMDMLAAEGDEQLLSASDFLSWFRLKAKEWEYSTFRLYRSAVRNNISTFFRGTFNAEEHIPELDSMTAEDTRTAARKNVSNIKNQIISDDNKKRTSSLKTKHLKEKDRELFTRWLIESDWEKVIDNKTYGFWKVRSIIFLLSGSVIGLRPSEWIGAQIEYSEEGDLFVTVKNAKATNGRAHGEKRVIAIPSDHFIKPFMERHLKEINSAVPLECSFDTYLKECNRAIKAAEKSIKETKGKITGYCMYTGRHQFSANMKKMQLTAGELAYLMGHASAKTAQAHYGKAARGYKGLKPGSQISEIIVTGELLENGSPIAARRRFATPSPAAAPEKDFGPNGI